MPYTVSALFTFKDNESKNKFITFCNGDKGLSVTRAFEGCQTLELYESRGNPLQLTIWQQWASQESQEKYIKFRHEDGSFKFLGELVASPPEITPLRPVVMKTDKEQIEEIVKDMCNKDYKVGNKHMSDECVFIRPSGNPLDKKGYCKMMSNDEVKVDVNELMEINKLSINDNMAYVCYTSHGKFTYHGTENDDVAVLSSVLEKTDGRWKVVFGQRSTGRKPTDDPVTFPTTVSTA